jgi:hypothetical protein
MREAVKNLSFLFHLHPVRMAFNAGSAETNAESQLMGEAIAA